MSLRAAPVYDRQGQVVAVRWIIRDITHRKRTEALRAPWPFDFKPSWKTNGRGLPEKSTTS